MEFLGYGWRQRDASEMAEDGIPGGGQRIVVEGRKVLLIEGYEELRRGAGGLALFSLTRRLVRWGLGYGFGFFCLSLFLLRLYFYFFFLRLIVMTRTPANITSRIVGTKYEYLP